ncbi:hypothetical protein C8J57DRAFT_1520389 [Mycena rebaudengoi]|nr:hypothetical protein C8J57DRAFT_1520389 [Mycena rebaudengoi]
MASPARGIGLSVHRAARADDGNGAEALAPVVGSASLVLDHHHLSPLLLPPFPPPPTPPSEPLATPAPPVTASKRKYLEAIAQLGEPVIPVPKNLKRAKRDALEQVGAGRPQDRGTIIRCATPYLDIGLVLHYESQARWVPPSPTDPTLSKDIGESKSDQAAQSGTGGGEEDIADNTLKRLVKGTLKLTYHKWPARFYADDSYKTSDPRKGLSFAAFLLRAGIPGRRPALRSTVPQVSSVSATHARPAPFKPGNDSVRLNVFSTHRTTSGTGADDASDDDDGDSDDEAIQAQRVARCGGVAAASLSINVLTIHNSRLLYYALQWNYYAFSLGGLVALKLECTFVSLCRLLSCIVMFWTQPLTHNLYCYHEVTLLTVSVSSRTVSLSCL